MILVIGGALSFWIMVVYCTSVRVAPPPYTRVNPNPQFSRPGPPPAYRPPSSTMGTSPGVPSFSKSTSSAPRSSNYNWSSSWNHYNYSRASPLGFDGGKRRETSWPEIACWLGGLVFLVMIWRCLPVFKKCNEPRNQVDDRAEMIMNKPYETKQPEIVIVK